MNMNRRCKILRHAASGRGLKPRTDRFLVARVAPAQKEGGSDYAYDENKEGNEYRLLALRSTVGLAHLANLTRRGPGRSRALAQANATARASSRALAQPTVTSTVEEPERRPPK